MASHLDALEQGETVNLRQELLTHFFHASEDSLRPTMIRILNRMPESFVAEEEKIDEFFQLLTEADNHFINHAADYGATLPVHAAEVLTYMHFHDDQDADLDGILSLEGGRLFQQIVELETNGSVIDEQHSFSLAAFLLRIRRLKDMEEFEQRLLNVCAPDTIQDLRDEYSHFLRYATRQPYLETDALGCEIAETEARVVGLLNNFGVTPQETPMWVFAHAAKYIGSRGDMEVYDTLGDLELPDGAYQPYVDMFEFFAQMTRGTIRETFVETAEHTLNPLYTAIREAESDRIPVSIPLVVMTMYGFVLDSEEVRYKIGQQIGKDYILALDALDEDGFKEDLVSHVPDHARETLLRAVRSHVCEKLRMRLTEVKQGALEVPVTRNQYDLMAQNLKHAAMLVNEGASSPYLLELCEKTQNYMREIAPQLIDSDQLDPEEHKDVCGQKPVDDLPEIEVEYGPTNMNGEIMVPANDR